MGIGPPRDEEIHEVVVQLEGKVSEDAFKEYVERLRDCLKQLAQLTDSQNRNAKLKVRQVQQRIVRRR